MFKLNLLGYSTSLCPKLRDLQRLFLLEKEIDFTMLEGYFVSISLKLEKPV